VNRLHLKEDANACFLRLGAVRWIRNIENALFYRQENSMWFSSIQDDEWLSAVNLINDDFMVFLDGVLTEWHEVGGRHLIPFQELMVKHWFYAPPFMLNQNETELLSEWKTQSVDEQRTFDRQRAGLIALQFLKMYCDEHMTSDGGQHQKCCDLLNTLKAKGVIPGGDQSESNSDSDSSSDSDSESSKRLNDPKKWKIPDERAIVLELQPKGHVLFDRIVDLLWSG